MYCKDCPACDQNHSISVSDWTCKDWTKVCPCSGVEGFERCIEIQRRFDNKCAGIKESEVKNG